MQIAPGGPVDQALANIEFGQTTGLPGSGAESASSRASFSHINPGDNQYRGARGLDPEVIAEIKKRYGFDKPLWQRYGEMLWNYLRLDFGDSLFRSASVIGLIKESLPVSIQPGTLEHPDYLSGVDSTGDLAKRCAMVAPLMSGSSAFIIIGYSIPAFLFGIMLIVLFAGGSYRDWFPLRGLTSAQHDTLPWYGKVLDYFWHIALPVLATVIGGFATLTMLTKNAFLDEIRKLYVVTARAKGVPERRILYHHVFRNAMLLVIASFPATFISMFFTSSVLIEVMFSLNGLGLLGYDATLQRDYPVMFGTLYIFTLIGLLMNILSDLTYTLVDPRIDFGSRS